MTDSDVLSDVAALLEADAGAFDERVRTEADRLLDDVRDGIFDNSQAIVGLEYEFYGVDRESTALCRVPRQLLQLIGFEPELGLHNAEMNTSPQPLNAYGLEAQRREVQAKIAAASRQTRSAGIELVSDGIWTIPPTGESAREYLTDTVTRDGITYSTNMTDNARYQAMSNTAYPAGKHVDAPHVSVSADTIGLESLITSIQPHYQVAHVEDLPTYVRYALRIAGPLLALGVNSPFFPPDCYDDGADPVAILEDGWMAHRIGVFEDVLNPTDGSQPKVCFPKDVDSVESAIDRIVEDIAIVPQEIAPRERFDDRYRHFDYKRGSYWRWVRPVFDAPTAVTANARVEFRPLPAQPTVSDCISFLAIFAGLMESLPRREHPVAGLSWEAARDNFYSAVRDGLDADLHWITVEGEETTSSDRLFTELFDAARDGLDTRGLDTATIDSYLEPIRLRYELDITPARWKHDHVRDAIDSGACLDDAITAMQRSYVDAQRKTLLAGTFGDWPGVIDHV